MELQFPGFSLQLFTKPLLLKDNSIKAMADYQLIRLNEFCIHRSLHHYGVILELVHQYMFCRCMVYVATELATDIVIKVGDVKFYLHKFPLLSKSSWLQQLVTTADEQSNDELIITDIPGGSAAFEICAKYCYGMVVTLNAHNVIAARCAAEYLGMHETMEKGNLAYKIDAFLHSVIFRSWKDSIIVLHSTKSMLPWSEDLKLISHCVEFIASKAVTDTSKVDWSYTYNRKKLQEETGTDPNWIGFKNKVVPNDWWVEDLCDLEVDSYKRVIVSINSKGIICGEVIGEALKAFTDRHFPSLIKSAHRCSDLTKYRSTVDTIISLLPDEKGCVSCSFLLKLLKAAILGDFDEVVKRELIKKIGHQLEQASVNELLIRAPEGDTLMYDVDIVLNIVHEFLIRDQISEIETIEADEEAEEFKNPGILSEASRLIVAKLVDGYLAEISRDRNLPVSKFIELAEMVSSIPMPGHDGLYRAIDMYLKEHSEISKSDRKKICKFMDCKKLSVEACMHAVQNERLPMRVIVQVLFFEQVRAAATSGTSTPDLPKSIRDINNGSQRSSKSTPIADEDWDTVATAEELKALKSELATLKLERKKSEKVVEGRQSIDKAGFHKMKGVVMTKKIFSKLLSNKSGNTHGGDTSGSDSSETPSSANPEEVKCRVSMNRRVSVS